MKMMKEDEKIERIFFLVDDILLHTIDTQNIMVFFLTKLSNIYNKKKTTRSIMDHLQCYL